MNNMDNNQCFLSLKQIRNFEQQAKDDGVDLMHLAATAIRDWVVSRFSCTAKILIIAGNGNNGGDGISAAILLKELGYSVEIHSIFSAANKLNSAVGVDANTGLIKRFKTNGGKVLHKLPNEIHLASYSLIIDAILGIGISKPISAPLAILIDKLNACSTTHKIPILSVDTPTGLDPFSGIVRGASIIANITITFISRKPGFYTGYGSEYVGEIILALDANDLKYQKYNLNAKHTQPTAISIYFNQLSTIDLSVLKRNNRKNTHKGTFGNVAILGNANNMLGALYLTGRSALLMGCGKVVIGLSSDKKTDSVTSLASLVNPLMPELIITSASKVLKQLHEYDVVVIGPGLGVGRKSVKLLYELLELLPANKLIFDADALNILATHTNLHYKFRILANKIITPHGKEAARLLGVNNQADTISEYLTITNRFAIIAQLAAKYNCASLLKGYGSLIQCKQQIYINQTGGPSLSSAGQGDTLCGIIAGIAACGLSLAQALRVGVFIHGQAADSLVASTGIYNGILASEVATHARTILNRILYNL